MEALTAELHSVLGPATSVKETWVVVTEAIYCKSKQQLHDHFVYSSCVHLLPSY